MKKVLVILGIVLLFTSCTTITILNSVQKEESFYGIDFRTYTEKGFLMTPENYSGEYESIGLITYKIIPAAKYVLINNKTKNVLYYNTYTDTYYWIKDDINFQNVLDSVYVNCVSMGADALINLKMNLISKEYLLDKYSKPISNPVTISGYEISGYAIKRK